MEAATENTGSIFRDFNPAAFGAGITAFVWYAFGAIPLHLAIASQLGLNAAQSSSWIFIVWFSGAVSSIAITLCYRQPIPITWTVPGLIYLGTLAGHFTFPEMVGASLMAGVLILLLALLGVGARIIAWLPLPIILGMFAGSILGYIARMVKATVDDFFIAGPTVFGYLIGKMINRQSVPPMGLAVLFGGAAVFLAQEGALPPIEWIPPQFTFPGMRFSFSAFVAISLPLVLFAMGMGNVQGLGYLIAQGYRVPVNKVSVIVGVNSILNAFLGGHPATVARTGGAIMAGPDAGPLEGRYWASLTAATLTFILALAAGTVTSLVTILPRSYALALAGLAILSTFQDALVKSASGALRFGALVAFAVAITPFIVAGINSAFWAILAGLLASLLTEREELFEFWRTKDGAGG
jgi:benzoate membrane transport protein